MESFVNNYYNQIEGATSEAERAQIKAEFAAKLQTLPEEQRQQVKALVGKRLKAFLETLAPIDSAIEQFAQYLQQREKTPTLPTQNAA
jgi:5'-deoxynucleotidase YfbR-like HD superfamily hydrolase